MPLLFDGVFVRVAEERFIGLLRYYDAAMGTPPRFDG
jgi:hypothetical protein